MVLAREHEDLRGLFVPEDCGRRVSGDLTSERHGAPHSHHLVLRGHQERGVGCGEKMAKNEKYG